MTVKVAVPPLAVLALAVKVVLPALTVFISPFLTFTTDSSAEVHSESVTPETVGSSLVEPYSMEMLWSFSSIHFA